MIEPSLTQDEPFRLKALRATKQLDTPLEERFERLTRLAQLILDVPIAAISLVDANRQWFKSIQGLNVQETSRAISFCGHTILQAEPFVIVDARKDVRFADNPLVTADPHIVFYAGCPVRAQDGSNIASLCVIDHKPRELSSSDMQALRDIAALVEVELSMRMQNAAHQELVDQVDSMIRLVHVDSLTRVWNRDAVRELLATEFARAKRGRGSVGVMMLDIDNFKGINDSFGHAAGDEVLRQVAKRALGAIREVDAVGRFGGDEFMIVLSHCDGENVDRVIAERVRKAVCEKPIVTEFGEVMASVSIGVACTMVPQATNADALIKVADDALYRAKRGGRNCVEVGSMTVRAVA